LEGEKKINDGFVMSYHGIPEDVRPSKSISITTYSNSQSSHVSLYLEEMNLSNLDALLDDALEMEGSILYSKLLAYSHLHYIKESGYEKEFKASSYTPYLVDLFLHEILLTL
jgi:hypothetical protein